MQYLLGLLESERGNTAASITDLQRAVTLNGRNLRAAYQLAEEVERQGDSGSDEQFKGLIRQILAADPGNLAAQLELSRIAAKTGDLPALKSALEGISARSAGWPAEVKAQLSQLQSAASGLQPRSAATRSIFLRNVLMRVPEFRDSLSDLKPAPGEGAQPMTLLLRLANLPSKPAPADMKMSFIGKALDAGAWSWVGAILLNGNDPPTLAMADSRSLHLSSGTTIPFPGGDENTPLLPGSVLPIDFNYDFKTDLVLAGAGGVRFLRQDDVSHFTDVTTGTNLPATVLQHAYTEAWALDIEADGDLDVLLGSSTGAPAVLRNNGDGSFTETHPFAGIKGLRQFAWVDLNGDGNPDAVLLDGEEHLHLFLNRRSGSFSETATPFGMTRIKGIAVGDVGKGDTLDLIAVTSSGDLVRLGKAEAEGQWKIATVATLPGSADLANGETRLFAEDLDNNGAVDLVVAHVGGRGAIPPTIFLASDHGNFEGLTQVAELRQVYGVADLKEDGHLALVGFNGDGVAATAAAYGTLDYRWQTIRPRAKQATGDQRINSFGVGGEIEIRSGMLVQKQSIRGPALHFGLGQQKVADVARILWPNGSVRAEFGLKSDEQIVTEQRLKGSCPFLFAWNGQKMEFVKDSVPWGSAIGLRINALGSAKIAATEEWYKIGRDQLRARNGFYDLRITGELWETYYYDSLGLMTVDHPADTEVFTDERFDVPAVKLAVTAVSKPEPLVRAVDDNGNDVTMTLSKLDDVYLDTFGRGQYQGVTRDHFVELTLPDELPRQSPLWLVAQGWLHPSDSSINIALSQGNAEKPRWLSLEVADGKGGWRVAKPNLGFPAGRKKICLFDLTGVFRRGEPHRVRLRTNLEIYWDQIEWARGLPSAPVRTQRLMPDVADLHYRGFSAIGQANASSPEIPQYDKLSGTTKRWRDLEGFYTRFGDVRELIGHTDDRYVIMNAGDEMSLRFREPAAPPVGWVRDYVITGDGWIKDGDYNSSYSQTVLPYPHHARVDYDSPPARLEEDWAYLHHAQDWQDYHTRYVTAHPFLGALQGKADQ